MSVAQVKKRFAEMTEYLNRDKEGQRRLKLLKDDVNVLRTSLAASEDALQLAQTIKDAARERADAAEAALAEAQREVQSLRNKIGSLMFDLSTVTRPEEPAEDRVSHRDESAVIKAALKALKKKSRPCPQATKEAVMLEDHTLFFDREEITPGWSYENLWALGASVAALSLMLGRIVIVSKRRFSDVCAEKDKKNVINNWLDWFGQHNISKEAFTEDLGKVCGDILHKRDSGDVRTGFGRLTRENPNADDDDDDDDDDDA